MRFLLFGFLFIAACNTPAPTVGAPNVAVVQMSDGDAIRRVEGLTATASYQTATAIVMATQNAVSTAARVAQMEALANQMTQDNHALAMAATSGALTATPAAISTSQQQTAVAHAATVTREATIEAQEAQAVAIELENSKQWGETSRSIFYAVAVVIAIAVTLFTSWGIITLRLFAQAENERRADRHEIEMMKLKLAAFAAAMRETRAGTIVPMLDGPPMILPPASILPPTTSDIPEAPFIINDGEDSYTVSRMTPAEIAAKEEVLEWIDLSIAWHNERGKIGRREHQLKRWDKIERDSEFQKRVTAYLGEAISVGSSGTFAAGGITLEELRRRVKVGEISLCVAHNHTHTYSTAQAETQV